MSCWLCLLCFLHYVEDVCYILVYCGVCVVMFGTAYVDEICCVWVLCWLIGQRKYDTPMVCAEVRVLCKLSLKDDNEDPPCSWACMDVCFCWHARERPAGWWFNAWKVILHAVWAWVDVCEEPQPIGGCVCMLSAPDQRDHSMLFAASGKGHMYVCLK